MSSQERHQRDFLATRPLYHVWREMNQRCRNPRRHNFANYGGRGITVCERWATSYEAFVSDMGPRPSERHSIDRIDTNGPYSPDNCRWADSGEQARNRRTNRLLTFDGQTRPLCDWAAAIGVSPKTLRARLDKYDWTIGRALTTPARSYTRKAA